MYVRCPSTYPGAVTLLGRPVRCDGYIGAPGHYPGAHGNSFAARYWTTDANDRDTARPMRGKPSRCYHCGAEVLWDETATPHRYACDFCRQRYSRWP